MTRLIILIAAVFCTAVPAFSRDNKTCEEFVRVCKELDSLLTLRTTVESELELNAVMKRGNQLDFYFTSSLSDLPWSGNDAAWFRRELEKRLPDQYRRYRIGRISSRGEKIEDLVTGSLVYDGKPWNSGYRMKNPPAREKTVVERNDGLHFSKGLEGRHIALWQSHGLYYEQSQGRWEWQRPCLFQTVEDLFTQSFVLPFLVPMLENAGAYVMLPRERDIQTHEIIIDNDPGFREIGSVSCSDAAAGIQENRLRLTGKYMETGNWSDAGTGFADARKAYTGTENPFTMGTARMAACVPEDGKAEDVSEAVWIPEIPERGEYAVYVSYTTLPNSTDAAHYTVHHLGGITEFHVNQRMGGGTWIYLGTFEFAEGEEGCVTLDNMVRDSRSGRKTAVTADAVKIGGGYGNIARSIEGDSTSIAEISGMPRFTEGARYWLQWAGIDSTIFSQNERKDDYKDDFMSRGDWVAYMSGGSRVNPDAEGKSIPFDLAFALHSDAGTTPNDSTIGTLAIYTLKSEGRRRLPSGEDRKTSREFAAMVQNQIVNDIRTDIDPEWNRRYIWDRGYRESRTPTCPSMLCELLSHQNFADMKLGLDPAFRFTVSRAIYKGMLKYLSGRYGTAYTVQPLPVNSFAVGFSEGKIRLSWKAAADPAEPTAVPESFILYTRTDDGAFDGGKVIKAVKENDGTFSYLADFEPGHMYSFRIEACNSGGKSFPSETLSAGIPSMAEERDSMTDSCILVVNNFTRISAPAWFDYPEYAGFDSRLDSGVPYIRETAFTGLMYQNRRGLPWLDDDCPGFGASYNDYAGSVIAGNTFDYPAVHGKAIMEAGYPFCSTSADAFCNDTSAAGAYWCIDLICGKQVTVKEGKRAKFTVFPERMQDALTDFTSAGGHVLVSGANIGTDIWDRIYPVSIDSTAREKAIDFAEDILGFSYRTNFAGRTGEVSVIPAITAMPMLTPGEKMQFNNKPDRHIYSVEAPDGIAPSGPQGTAFLRYEDTRISAAVSSDFGTYRTVCIGFPLEILQEKDSIGKLIGASIGFFRSNTCK